MADIIAILVTALAAFAGGTASTLLSRKLTNAATQEQVDLLTGIANLKKAYVEAGLPEEEWAPLYTELLSKARPLNAKAIANAVVPAEDSMADETQPYWSQAEMNRRAGASAAVADAQLGQKLAELYGHLPEEEHALCEASQKAWEKYRNLEADLRSTIVKGGSMQPLLRSSAYEALTIQRIGAVEDAVKEREI